jgi:hypothetical protein
VAHAPSRWSRPMSPGSSAQPAQPGILLRPALSATAAALWCAAAPCASVCLPLAPSGKGKDAPSPPLHFPLEWTMSRPLRSPCWPIKGTTISLFCTASHCTTHSTSPLLAPSKLSSEGFAAATSSPPSARLCHHITGCRTR